MIVTVKPWNDKYIVKLDRISIFLSKDELKELATVFESLFPADCPE